MAQPVTFKTVLAKGGNVLTLPTVTFATGRCLGVGNTTPQSIYVMKDDLTATGLGTVRSNADMVQQTMTAAVVGGSATRRDTVLLFDWATMSGCSST